ncbi:MAG: (d)CMP kinase [Eubacterium sp.]|nr:(d)CMP kinase [Eubacterium sp.]
MSFQIAIDGPAGAGKSTIAKKVAETLGYLYVDTGAMYRAMGMFFLEKGTKTEAEEEVLQTVKEADIDFRRQNDDSWHVYLNGRDVSGEIRTEQAGMMASNVAVLSPVRAKLVELQQRIASRENVVMDGRDIGTVVLKNAALKIYLTASVEVRADRRVGELKEKGMDPDAEKIKKEIRARDEQDMNRKISPLRQADDAVLLDTSDMTIEEAVNAVLELARERQNG